MNKQTVTDRDGNLYVAKTATDACEGCVFNGEVFCDAPEKAHCEGLIWEKATPEDVKQRNTFDKATLWLLGISAAYIGAIVWFVWHTVTKYNN